MYTPLYIKTTYSLLSSLITIDKLLIYLEEHHFSSVSLVDDNLYGMMEFYQKCKKHNIKPIIGLEVYLDNSSVLLYAKGYQGYQSLIKLATIQSSKKVTIDEVLEYKNEVIMIIPFEFRDTYHLFLDKISDLYLGFGNKTEEKEALLITKNVVFIRKNLYLYNQDSEYLKYLYMIRDGKTILDEVNYDTDNYQLDVSNIYDYTSNTSLFNSNKIADMCNLEFPKASLLLPIYSETSGLSSHEYLKKLSLLGLNKRLNQQVSSIYLDRLNYELSIIDQMGFSNYFLVVYDFIRYAKKNKILVGPGRGSGAGSLVCFSIGITDIDPIKYNLFFERFLNPERITMPDIDTDFPDVYRDQVIDYVVNKYGQKRVSGIVTFGTLAAKQSLRDVARVLNVPSYQIDLITKRIPGFTKEKLKDFYQNDSEFKKLVDSSDKLTLLYKIASFIEGYPRHTSSHAGGIVMCQKDLDEVIPLTMSDGMYLSGLSMEYLEDFGLLKMDFLGLKTLTTIMNIIKDIEEKENIIIDFNTIPLNDLKVLDLFARADTTGIFQFESEGMRNFLRKLKPQTFEDIFAAIALFRPGPAVNIDTYIRRRHGEEVPNYYHPDLEPILKNTYGIIIYQEQIMQIASTLAGYSLGEADILRRAMSKKKMDVLANEEKKFITNSVSRGYDQKIAKEVYDLILNFANYGFNRSHSVAYSMVAYKMAYLKCYYPKYFYSSLLSSVIGSDTKTKDYILEVKALNIEVLKPSINRSSSSYEVYSEGIYYPFTGIRSVGGVACLEIVNKRGEGYKDIFDFLSKVKGINRKVLESLILSGCFDEFGLSRKTYLENLDSIINYSELVSDLEPEFVLKPELINYPEYTKEELIATEKDLYGFYLSNHPVTSYKAKYNNIMSLEKSSISNNFNRNITTIVLVERLRVIKTKKGEEMMFFDGGDEYAQISFTVFPKTYQQYSHLQVGDILIVRGTVERRYDSFQIIVSSLEKLNK